LWQRIAGGAPHQPKSVAQAAFPTPRDEWNDATAEREMDLLKEIIVSARNLRAQMKLDPKKQVDGVLYARDGAHRVAQTQAEAIRKLAGVALEISAEDPPAQSAAMRSTTEFDLALKVSGAQVEAQRKRLEKEIQQLEKVIGSSKKQLGNERFLERAPEDVVASIREKLIEYESQLEKSKAALAGLT
ncbi:MAG: class I tRNA ligase family protein, partial [bacterium]|nr:class I tRNA ligase family protein [bacterium]